MNVAEQRKKRAEYMAAWRSRNLDKTRATVRAWGAKYPERKRAYSAAWKTRAGKFAPWADKDLIFDIYAYALIMRSVGIDCHVDHILPIKGADVSGLHVENNLTVLLAEDNIQKGTKWDF